MALAASLQAVAGRLGGMRQPVTRRAWVVTGGSAHRGLGEAQATARSSLNATLPQAELLACLRSLVSGMGRVCLYARGEEATA